MKQYHSLFKLYPHQAFENVFAHFYPRNNDYDESFKEIARCSSDGYDAWGFQQTRFKDKHKSSEVPKLKNYLNYTFMRLLVLEEDAPGCHFLHTQDGEWVCFNTGLQNSYAVDLIAMFQKYIPKQGETEVRPDWVYKGCYASNHKFFRRFFASPTVPEIAWYSKDSRDYVFDISYALEKDSFEHLFERAKERSGLLNAPDEVVRNYLRGAIENLLPKIRRNYKVAIPVYYIEEKRMQLLLPFASASNADEVSCFLVERNDAISSYNLKTIFDLDQAYFAARLITRPDKEWLNP